MPGLSQKQSRVLLVLGVLLAAGGLATVVFARKLPLPLRIEAAFWDLVAAAAILLFRRQRSA